ncbi:cache type 2 domain-containing protein [Ramlibacter terrae]|uniref:Cache type 2 domain-containing protein n=1 Tax=Ramlibacter terrae TaxID=2732511 RepID=A0ABX6P8U1_9BURK|nr:cache type 2 domain-containing protein [Ramlibacter terrae]
MNNPAMNKLLALALLFVASAAFSGPQPTEKDAVAMTEKAAAYMKAKGKAAVIKKITAKDAEFLRGSLYVEMRDLNTGVTIAHPINQSVVGKNLLDTPDAGGKKFRRDILQLAQTKGRGWVAYQYKNPASGNIEPGKVYVLRVDDVVLEAGIYRN